MRFILFFLCTFFLFSFSPEAKISKFKNGLAEVNGTKLYYEMLGEGEPIVFVHGNFGDHRHWDFQFAPLSKKI